MESGRALTAIGAASIALVLTAIVAQALALANANAFNATRFFAFFTIQSNLVGVAAFAWVLANRDKPRSRALELLRGAAAMYLTITFFVVIFLLSGVDVQVQLGWVDFVLHKLFPASSSSTGSSTRHRPGWACATLRSGSSTRSRGPP